MRNLDRPKRKERLSPRKQPIQPRARVTVEVILEAAAQVFSEEGYHATTNRIAQRAGVSIGSLYQYFHDKDEILSSLLNRHVREGHDLISRELPGILAPGKITRATIRRLIEIMIGQHERDPALHRVLFEQVQLELFRKGYTANEELAIGHLRLLLGHTPKARKKGSASAVRLVVHAIEAMTHRFVLYGYEGVDKAEFVGEMTDMIESYLLNRRNRE
jgi:AcrR family transcriptional regulator